MAPRWWALAAGAACAAAHNSIVCSSTSAARPGEVVFWVGTYHLQAQPSSYGVAHLETTGADGVSSTVQTEPYVGCSAQGCATPPCAAADPGLRGDVPIIWLRTGLLAGHCSRAVSASGGVLITTDTWLTCYEAHSPNLMASPVWHGRGTDSSREGLREQINCNGRAEGTKLASRDINTFYAAAFPNVRTGFHQFYLDSADPVLEPSPKAQQTTPCASTESSKFTFHVSVADGGAACPAAPPAAGSIDAASLEPCLTPPEGASGWFSGYQCNVVCAPGFILVGQLLCSNGAWSRYECTQATTCALPGRRGVSGVLNTEYLWSGNDTHNDTQVWDIWNLDGVGGTGGGNGSNVSSPCGDATLPGTVCGYTCSEDAVVPGAVPFHGGRGVDVRTPSGVREAIRCGDDGMWYPEGDFCGCLIPCVNFTRPPTAAPTPEPPTPAPPTPAPPATWCQIFTTEDYCSEGNHAHLVWVPFLLTFLLCGMCAVLIMAALFTNYYWRRVDVDSALENSAAATRPTRCPVDDITVGVANVLPPYYAFEAPERLQHYHQAVVPMQMELLRLPDDAPSAADDVTTQADDGPGLSPASQPASTLDDAPLHHLGSSRPRRRPSLAVDIPSRRSSVSLLTASVASLPGKLAAPPPPSRPRRGSTHGPPAAVPRSNSTLPVDDNATDARQMRL